MSQIRRIRSTCLLLLVAGLASSACQSQRNESKFPTLHPRERALYTSIVFEPSGTKLQLASLTRQRTNQAFAAQGVDGSSVELEVELIADREAESLYGGRILIRTRDGSWSSAYRLPPRSSGRWQFMLDPTTNPLASDRLLVEVEPDPYWKMDQQRPLRFRRGD